MNDLLEVDDNNFQNEILESTVPAMVDFWAPWCQPCFIVAPWVEELAKEYEGKIKVAKINVDQNPNIPNRYGIRAIPSILLFKDGELKDTIVGAVGKSNIEQAVQRLT